MKLLVAVDGLGAAQRALQQAIALAPNDPRWLDPPRARARRAGHLRRDRGVRAARQDGRAAACEQRGVLAAAEDAAGLKDSNVRYTKDVLTGPIGPTIARHAERLGCDAIVMGRHGKTTVGDLFMARWR